MHFRNVGSPNIIFKHYSLQSVFFYRKSLLLLTLFYYHPSITTTPSELSTLLLGAQLLEQEAQFQTRKKYFFKNFSISSKASLFKKQRGQQSTSKTKSSHLIYYIYVYDFLHSNSIYRTQSHLIYYFQTLFTLNCVFYQQLLLLLTLFYYHPSITLFMEELPTLRVIRV